jgi:hypothetical protein
VRFPRFGDRLGPAQERSSSLSVEAYTMRSWTKVFGALMALFIAVPLSAAAQCYVCSGQFECEDWAYTTTGCPFSGEYPPWYECENIQGMCTVYYGDLPAELGIEESDVLTIEILIAEELVAMSVTEVDDGLYGWWNCDGEIQYLYEKTEEGWVPAKNILLNRAKYSIAKLSQ